MIISIGNDIAPVADIKPLQVKIIHLSLSHTEQYAVAVAILEK